MIKRAVILLVALAILHLLGGREAMGFLSGSQPVGEGVPLLGAAYFVAWFGAVLLAPILLIAAALSAAYGRIAPGFRAWLASSRR